jgi:hypothetical protein
MDQNRIGRHALINGWDTIAGGLRFAPASVS